VSLYFYRNALEFPGYVVLFYSSVLRQHLILISIVVTFLRDRFKCLISRLKWSRWSTNSAMSP